MFEKKEAETWFIELSSFINNISTSFFHYIIDYKGY